MSVPVMNSGHTPSGSSSASRSRSPTPPALCVAAAFEPRIAATVEDVATALGLVAIGWGITIAPQLSPSGPHTLVRLPLAGVQTVRNRILVVRDGEHLSPGIAAVVAAVQEANRAVDRADPARA